jgi:hypothetical protein
MQTRQLAVCCPVIWHRLHQQHTCRCCYTRQSTRNTQHRAHTHWQQVGHCPSMPFCPLEGNTSVDSSSTFCSICPYQTHTLKHTNTIEQKCFPWEAARTPKSSAKLSNPPQHTPCNCHSPTRSHAAVAAGLHTVPRRSTGGCIRTTHITASQAVSGFSTEQKGHAPCAIISCTTLGQKLGPKFQACQQASHSQVAVCTANLL